jgi:hypothetical protein
LSGDVLEFIFNIFLFFFFSFSFFLISRQVIFALFLNFGNFSFFFFFDFLDGVSGIFRNINNLNITVLEVSNSDHPFFFFGIIFETEGFKGSSLGFINIDPRLNISFIFMLVFGHDLETVSAF